MNEELSNVVTFLTGAGGAVAVCWMWIKNLREWVVKLMHTISEKDAEIARLHAQQVEMTREVTEGLNSMQSLTTALEHALKDTQD